jgi:hypothetical protein
MNEWFRQRFWTVQALLWANAACVDYWCLLCNAPLLKLYWAGEQPGQMIDERSV